MISINELKININEAALRGEAFLFFMDYELTQGEFILNPLENKEILWRVGEHSNTQSPKERKDVFFHRNPISYTSYSEKFNYVKEQLQKGNSFLANLTIKTPISTNYSLEEIFYQSQSLYALCVPNQFVCFSPETFVKIENGKISSNPMKGTISADNENAEQKIMENYKETAEHHTIVDLIRSDLSRVGTNIQVDKFRYIDRLQTSEGDILQVSSQISGDLATNYLENLGDILLKLLPAGSICGAPKESTVKILQAAEKSPRGFYTGVFGYFDGKNLDTAVMIRFIEQTKNHLYFRSGGGITINSNCKEEYEEALKKVYLPFKSVSKK